MKLEKGEYTTKGFLEFLEKKFKSKINDKRFTSNDVAQYLIKGYTPYRYGRIKITATTQDGIRIIKIDNDKN